MRTRYRYGWYIGSLILALLVRLYFARWTPLDPDEQLHVFIARVDDWSIFFREILNNSHPPLFYLLLKGALSLDHSLLAERTIPIACGLVSIIYVGKISRRLGLGPHFEIFAVLATTLSTSHIMISLEVRSYMLTNALTLISLYYYLDYVLLKPPSTLNRRAAFYLATAGAAFSHFSAAIYLAAIAAVTILFVAADRSYRRALRDTARRFSFKPVYTLDLALVLALSCSYGAFLTAWGSHGASLTSWARAANSVVHLQPFLRRQGQNAWDFFLNGAVDEFNLFSPIPASSSHSALIALGLLILAAGALIGRALRHPRRDQLPPAAAAVERVKLALPFALAAAAFSILSVLAGLFRYPFGGALRHQFVLFPFLTLCYAQGLSLLVDAFAREGRLATKAVLGTGMMIVLLVFFHAAARAPSSPPVAISPDSPIWPSSPYSQDATLVFEQVRTGGYLFLPTYTEFLVTLMWFERFELRTRSVPRLPLDLYDYFDDQGQRRLSVLRDGIPRPADISCVEELRRLRQIMQAVGADEITVYSKLGLLKKRLTSKEQREYETRLQRAVRDAGLELQMLIPVPSGAIVTVATASEP